MEFTSSFDIATYDKLTLPSSVSTQPPCLAGDDVQAHIDSIIGSAWDFGTESSLPLPAREYYGPDVVVMMFANVLEKTSKTVVLVDSSNQRFFISFSSTKDFDKSEVLAHFNLTLDDELDNYKHTNEILHDVQRHTLILDSLHEGHDKEHTIVYNHSPDSGLVCLRDLEQQIKTLRKSLVVGSPRDNILRQADSHVRHQCLELEVKRYGMKKMIEEVNRLLSVLPE